MEQSSLACVPAARAATCLLCAVFQVGSHVAADYAYLVQEAADALHAAVPGSSVSVDVPWSPFDVDGRNYDWLKLAAAADILFIMAYDTQSQVMRELCSAQRTLISCAP